MLAQYRGMCSNYRLASFALLSLVMFAGCAADGASTASDSQDLSGDGLERPTSGTFERRERLEMAEDGKSFTRSVLDPATGIAFRSERFELEGREVWAVNPLSGERDIACGTMEPDAEGASFSQDCQFAAYYELQYGSDLVYEHRERIDLAPGGFTRTILNPASGEILTAHPEKFIIEGDTAWSVHFASGEKQERCGKVSVASESAMFEGCGLWGVYWAAK